MRKFLLSISAFLICGISLLAGPVQDNIKLKLNSETGVYAKGETVKLIANVAEVPEGDIVMRVYQDGVKKPVSTKSVVLKQGENILIEESYDKTAALMIALGSKTDNKDKVMAGWVVAPEGFTPGFEEPKDLMSWWQGEIKKMRKQKIKAKLTPVEMCEGKNSDKFEAFDLEVNCVGDAPARGYLVKPKDAAKGSLPIILYVHGAGVKGPTNRSLVRMAFGDARRGNGAIAVDLNAHGMLGGQPQSYYDALDKNELAGYATREPETRDNYYFKWMFLRVQRMIDYLVTDPAWDGKHIIVWGGSQGGAQTCFIASVDSRVTGALVSVPAMLDQGGSLQGRRSSWPGVTDKYGMDSAAGKVCPYFDPALMLKYAKADFWIELGLYDETCPPANVYAGINQITSPKEIHPFQRGHGARKDADYKAAHKPLDKSKAEFFLREMTK